LSQQPSRLHRSRELGIADGTIERRTRRSEATGLVQIARSTDHGDLSWHAVDHPIPIFIMLGFILGFSLNKKRKST
jgi:hypothetical protein